MSVITITLFKSLSDRIAAQVGILEQAYSDARATGNGKRYTRIHDGLGSGGDFDVENDLIKTANELDTNIANSTQLNNIFAGVVTADQRHVQRFSYTNLDSYLSGLGLNVADGYAHAYAAVFGTELKSINVFGPHTNLASLIFSTSGTATFTSLGDTGSGGSSSHTDTASTGYPTGNHAGAICQVMVYSGISTNAAQIAFHMKQEDGNVVSRTVNWSGAELGVFGNKKYISSSAADKFLGVSSLTQVAGGTSGLGLIVYSELERTVAL